MPIATPVPVVTPAAAPVQFDSEKLKREIAEQNETRMRQMEKTIMDGIKSATAPVKPVPVTNIPENLGEYSADLKELGLDKDPKAAEALIAIASKIAAKNTGDLKKEVKNEVTSELALKQKKEKLDFDTASKYPQILDTTSALYKETEKVFKSFSKAILESPESTSLAIIQAASNLGIAPLDLASLRAQDAVNHTTSGGSGNIQHAEVTNKQKDFAAAFGVKADVFEKKLKLIRERGLKHA